MRKKVTVVGGGFVGSTTAQRIVDKGLADVVLTDILDGVYACAGEKRNARDAHGRP